MVLETERLYLREFSIDDAQNLFELNTDPEVLEFTGDSPFSNIKESEQFIHAYNAYQVTGYGRWAVIRKSDKQFLGWCGLKYHPLQKYTDLGFRFFKTFWNQGFATESSRGVIEYAFTDLGLDNLVARVESENKSSVAVLNKLGFTLESHIEFNNAKGCLFRITKQ